MSQSLAPDPRRSVLEALRTKACMKQDVYGRIRDLFTQLKGVCAEVADDLAGQVKLTDERLQVSYADKGDTSFELRVAGDLVVFNMHTNVFRLDQSHGLWKTSYLEEDELRGYFGVINIYNFLNDSVKFNRDRDIGYLVARLMLNREGHFFLQGKRQLGFLYNNLQHDVMVPDSLRTMVYHVVDYVLSFDLLAPPYDQVSQVSVQELKEMYANQQFSTGKRMGFRFQADVNDVT